MQGHKEPATSVLTAVLSNNRHKHHIDCHRKGYFKVHFCSSLLQSAIQLFTNGVSLMYLCVSERYYYMKIIKEQ